MENNVDSTRLSRRRRNPSNRNQKLHRKEKGLSDQPRPPEARQADTGINRRPIKEPQLHDGQACRRSEIHVDSKFEAYNLLTPAPKEERKEMEEYFIKWTEGNYSSSFGNFLTLKRAKKAAKDKREKETCLTNYKNWCSGLTQTRTRTNRTRNWMVQAATSTQEWRT